MKSFNKAEKVTSSFIRFFICITLVCFLVLSSIAFQSVSVISILDKDGMEKNVFTFNKGDEFVIRFTHSWNRTPIDEVFRIGDSGLELQETLFEDFGAGLQSYEEPGQKMELIGNKIRISGIKRPVPDLTYRVGQVIANHCLIVNEKETPLSVFVKPGEPVQFKLNNVHRWRLWRDFIICRI
jgi:hypothetical protein